MRLRLLLPHKMLFEGQIAKITAETEDGYFTLLPRHLDFVTSLVPGLLYVTTEQGREIFFAVDVGTLVKCGSQVYVACFNAMHGPNLGTLRDAVEQEFRALDAQEAQARSALAHLEADFLRRYIELGERTYER